MKVRVGYGLGAGALSGGAAGFSELVDELERLRFDSLWLSERATSGAPDPIVGLAAAAARTQRLKLGFSVLVLPGRNPALLAKQLASLDVLSSGRLLPAFGLGVADAAEQQAFGVAREERAERFDESLQLLRRFWSEDAVTHKGRYFRYDSLRIRPQPAQEPLDVWLGGRAPSELRRVGRLGDGWLPSFTTPAVAAEGRGVVAEAARRAGREIDPEHWGALITYLPEGAQPSPRMAALVKARVGEGAGVGDVVPLGHQAVARAIRRFVDVGFSKFVLALAGSPSSGWRGELESLAAQVKPLET